LKESLKHSYRDQIYAYYLGREVDPELFIEQLDQAQMNRQFKGWWKRHIPMDREVPILDLGCGWGGFLSYLKSEGYTDLSGVDNSAQQVEIAHRLGLLKVEVGDAFEVLKRHKNHYACISAFNLLEHLSKENVLPFLTAALEALQPGGVLLLEIPNANSLFGSRTRYWDFTHESSFTPTSLLQILTVTGFITIQLGERAPIAHGLKSYVRVLLWRMIRQILKFYLLVEQGAVGHPIFSQDMHVVACKPQK
jgi:cyclopropane fatty-acyl-phospholipid synthase-like methyltransferase